MKRKYVKPELYFESFELSSSIAAGCKLISNSAEYACPVRDPDFDKTIFTNDGCDYSPQDDDTKICYQPPEGNIHVYTSL